jgi:hypothetical protein
MMPTNHESTPAMMLRRCLGFALFVRCSVVARCARVVGVGCWEAGVPTRPHGKRRRAAGVHNTEIAGTHPAADSGLASDVTTMGRRAGLRQGITLLKVGTGKASDDDFGQVSGDGLWASMRR